MLAKSLIAAGAVAISLAALEPVEEASAKTKVFVDIGIGTGYYPYPAYGYDVGYGYGGGISCWKGAKIVKWAGFRDVGPYDCGGPVYGYKARKFGDWYKVKVNWQGDIVSVRHL